MISPSEYVQLIKILYRQHSNPDVAQGQMKYMKFQFDYFGLKAPVWVALLKEVFKKNGVYDRGEELAEFVQLCYDEPQREMQYAAIEMVQKNIKKLDANFIETLESMILQKSWWDSVDWIAAKLVSVHLNKFPELLKTKPYQWIKYTGKTAKDPDMWLQRTAIIFQLKYKHSTDTKMLYDFIKQKADSKEFFIQKASGWALREYSKYNPDSVLDFVQNNPQLAPLTKREALRLIKN